MAPSVGASPADAHEWVSFEDPAEERTWRFDVTFLLSHWECVYGTVLPGRTHRSCSGNGPGMLFLWRPFHR